MPEIYVEGNPVEGYLGGTAQVVIYFSEAMPHWIPAPKTTATREVWGVQYPLGLAAQMRFCYALDELCELPSQWQPYQESYKIPIPVTWLGKRKLWLRAEFRDGSGKPVPIEFRNWDQTGTPHTEIGLVSNMPTITAAPSEVVVRATAMAAATATWQAFAQSHVTGSVSIPFVGSAPVGTAVPMEADFSAASPFAPVTEMRVKYGDLGGYILNTDCTDQALLHDVQWEPFAPVRSFPVTAPAWNFFSFDVMVQYRDARGNLSPIYCADTGLEGWPPPTSQ